MCHSINHRALKSGLMRSEGQYKNTIKILLIDFRWQQSSFNSDYKGYMKSIATAHANQALAITLTGLLPQNYFSILHQDS